MSKRETMKSEKKLITEKLCDGTWLEISSVLLVLFVAVAVFRVFVILLSLVRFIYGSSLTGHWQTVCYSYSRATHIDCANNDSVSSDDNLCTIWHIPQPIN